MNIIRQKPILVKPAIPTKNELKELSDIDNQLQFQSHVIMSYKGSKKQSLDPVKVIKEALSKTLVYYYPFAGRIREGANKKLMVECNGEGVLFIEADALRVSLEEIQDQILPPCPLFEDLIYDVPGSNGILHSPLLLIQVTRFICGSYVVGIRVNHCMCDALGLAQFFKAIAEISRGAAKPSVTPVWQREHLIARYPLTATYTRHECQEVDNIDSNKKWLHDEGDNIITHGCFYFGPKHIQAIRNLLPPEQQNSCSTFELLCAFVWKCRILALQPANLEETIKFAMYVNIRGNDFIHLPLGYYGNAAVTATVATKTKDLVRKNSLVHALQLVKDSKIKAKEEQAKSTMEHMVTDESSKQAMMHSVWKMTNLVYVGFENVDFGWGPPMYCGLPRVHDSVTGLMGSFKDWRTVVMCLPKHAMLRLHKVMGEMIGEPFNSLCMLQPREKISKL